MKNVSKQTRQTSERSFVYFLSLFMGITVFLSSCSEKNVVPSSSLTSDIQAGEKMVSINGVKAQVINDMLHFDTYQAAEEARLYFSKIAGGGEYESLKSKVGALHFSQSLFYKFEQLKNQYGEGSSLYAQSIKGLPKVGSFVDYQILMNQDGAYAAGNVIYMFDKEGNIYSIEKLDYNLLSELKKAGNPLALAKQKGIYVEEKAIRDAKLPHGDATSPQTEESYSDTYTTSSFTVNNKTYRYKAEGTLITRHPFGEKASAETSITIWSQQKKDGIWYNVEVDIIATDGVLTVDQENKETGEDFGIYEESKNKNFVWWRNTAYGPKNTFDSPWKNVYAWIDILLKNDGKWSPQRTVKLEW